MSDSNLSPQEMRERRLQAIARQALERQEQEQADLALARALAVQEEMEATIDETSVEATIDEPSVEATIDNPNVEASIEEPNVDNLNAEPLSHNPATDAIATVATVGTGTPVNLAFNLNFTLSSGSSIRDILQSFFAGNSLAASPRKAQVTEMPPDMLSSSKTRSADFFEGPSTSRGTTSSAASRTLNLEAGPSTSRGTTSSAASRTQNLEAGPSTSRSTTSSAASRTLNLQAGPSTSRVKTSSAASRTPDLEAVPSSSRGNGSNGAFEGFEEEEASSSGAGGDIVDLTQDQEFPEDHFDFRDDSYSSDDSDFIPPSQPKKRKSLSLSQQPAKKISNTSAQASVRSYLSGLNQDQRHQTTPQSRARQLSASQPAPRPQTPPTLAQQEAEAREVAESVGLCVVCTVNTVNARLRCGHAFCVNCLQTLKAQKKPCPKCRQAFRKWEPLYL
ncbi:uncharacterized protein LOC117644043 [Thrips palmi]|uniref:Uncharacterized protein LOC117644043 n=1 Tax=Thrips palmi TaxID=161013 RepID=A0A6P8ZLM6_THRPL|nr:uncharacterized protein LOC117644043 [Thrips palmi]